MKNGIKKNTAKEHRVPRATLFLRLELTFTQLRMGLNTVVNSDEKFVIEIWVSEKCCKGFPKRKKDIQDVVKEVKSAPYSPFTNNVPGKPGTRSSCRS